MDRNGNPINKWIAASFVGLAVSIGISYLLMSFSAPLSIQAALIVIMHLPVFIGGLAAGFIAGQKGWLLGLLVAIMRNLMSTTSGVMKIEITWMVTITIIGIIGGFIGEKLAQIWQCGRRNSEH